MELKRAPMLQFVKDKIKGLKSQLNHLTTVIQRYKLRNSHKIIMCSVLAIFFMVTYLNIKTAKNQYILELDKNLIIKSPKDKIEITSVNEITFTKSLDNIVVMPLKMVTIRDSPDGHVLVTSPKDDIVIKVPENIINQNSLKNINTLKNIIIKPPRDVLIIKSNSEIIIKSLKNSIFVTPEEEIILPSDFIYKPEDNVIIKSMSKDSQVIINAPKDNFVLKLPENIVKSIKDYNLLKRTDFVEAHIVNNVTSHHKKFQVFLKWLSVQKFMNEEFNVTMIKNFVKLYNEIAGIPKIEPSANSSVDKLPICVLSHDKGNGSVNVTRTVTRYPADVYPMVQRGGYYKPQSCQSRDKVAILVPIKDYNHEEYLRVFLYNIHPFLMRQQLEYRIFVLEQSRKQDPLNKGRLYNAAFHEIQALGDWHCLVFHDVELLPTDYRIRYSCPIMPRHMSPVVIEEENNSTHSSEFGGVTAMITWQFRIVNGYSNMYWGGGEGDDMFIRLKDSGLRVARYKKNTAQYVTLSRSNTSGLVHRNQRRIDRLLDSANERSHVDGLPNNKYRKITSILHRLCTRIVIDVNPDREQIPL